MKRIITYILITILLTVHSGNTVSAANSPRKKIQFRNLSTLENINSKPTQIYFDARSLESRKILRIFYKANDLINGTNYPLNVKAELYVFRNGNKKILKIMNKSLKSNKSSKNVIFTTQVLLIEDNEKIYIDLFDSNNRPYGTYSYTVDLVDNNFLEESPAETDLDSISAASCSEGLTDPECLLEFFLQNVNFTASYDKKLITEVTRDAQGSYNVVLPIKKGRRIGKKVGKFRVKGSDSDGGLQLEDGYYPFFNNNDLEIGAVRYDAQNGISFGIGGNQNSFTILNNGGISIAPNSLETDLIDGAFEYDGEDLYFTADGERINITGSLKDILDGDFTAIDLSNGGYLNGDIYFADSSELYNANFNGETFFSNSSVTQFNGSILIPNGANQGLVLTSDANGNATWQPIPSSADDLGNHIAGTNLNLNGFSLINAQDVNGITANFQNGNFQNISVNGNAFFTDNSTTQINGQLIIPNGSNAGFVLTSDANGVTSWTSPLVTFVNGDDLGSHLAITNLDMDTYGIVNVGALQILPGAANGLILASDVNGFGSWQDLNTLANNSISNLNNITLEAPTINGLALFTNNSTAQFNGQIIIPGGANTGFVLTTDANGVATWQAIPSSADDLGSHIAGQNLNLNGFSLINAQDINGITANFANGNFTNIVNSPLFNGGVFNGLAANINGLITTNTINGINANFANGTFTTTQSNLFNGNTFNGIEANFTNGNFVNLNATNLFLSNLNTANGNFTNIVNSPLFNGGIFNGAAANLTGALTATTINGTQANFSDLNAANGNFTNIVNSPLFNGGIFNGSIANLNDVNAVNGNFNTVNANFINGGIFTGTLQDPIINGLALFTNNSTAQFNGQVIIQNGATAGFILTSDANGLATWQAIPSSADNLGNHIAGQNLNLNGFSLINAQDINGITANFANGTFTNIVNSALFNGGVFNGLAANINGLITTNTINGINANFANGTFTTIQSNLFNGNTFNGIEANFTNGNFVNLNAANLSIVNSTAANGTFTNIVNSPLFNGGIFNGAAANLTGALTATTINGSQANFSNLNAANGNFTNIVNSPLFNGGIFNGSVANLNDVNAANGNFNTVNANFINGGTFTGTLQDPVINGFALFTNNSIAQLNGQVIIQNGATAGFILTSDANGLATWQAIPSSADNLGNHIAGQNLNLNGFSLINAQDINGITANFANGNFTNIVNSALFNGGVFNGLAVNITGLITTNTINGINANFTNGTFTTTQSNLFNGTTFNGIEANFTNGNFVNLVATNLSISNLNAANGNFTNIVNSALFNGGIFNGAAANLTGTLTATTINGSQANFSNLNAANGNFTSIVNSPLFNGGIFNGSVANLNDVNAVNGNFNTVNANFINGGTFTGTLQDPIINGLALFSNNSIAQFNGQVIIQNGATAGFILTSDANGLATWQPAPLGADDLGSHIAGQNLNLNGFSLINAQDVNGITANFANGTFTNIVNSALFNGGVFNGLTANINGLITTNTINGINANFSNGTFTTTQSNLFNGTTFNGIEANFSNGNFVNLNAANLTISNLNAANGNFTNIVNSPLFNGGIFNGAAANLTGALTATTVNGIQANFSEINAANGNFTNIVNSPLFNGGDFVGNNVNATNGTFVITQSTLFNGSTFNGIAANFTNGNFATVNASLINGGTFTGTLQDPVINGFALFTNNSTAQFNGQVIIQNGATAGFILTSDANGLATWQPAPLGADDLGSHIAGQNLNLNGFSLINAQDINGITANFANGNFTNIVNSPLFNGGVFNGLAANINGLITTNTINGINANFSNGTFTTTQSNLFNGTTFNGIEANFTNGNFVNLNATNLSISNLNAANGNFTNIVNSPLFNGGIFNGAAANLTGALTATTVNGIQANFSEINAANGNFTNIVNSPLFNGGDFAGNNVNATNGNFVTTQSTLFNGTTFNGIEANFTNGNFVNLVATNLTLSNLNAVNGTFTNIVSSPLFNGGIFNGTAANLTGTLTAATVNGTQANFSELNAANGNFTNIVNSPLFNGGDFVGNNVNATNGTFITTQSSLFNGTTFNGIEANFTNGNFVNLNATNLSISNLNAANGNFTNIVNSPLFNGGIFNGAATNLTGALTATTVNGIQANFSELNAANGNFANIVNSPLFNGGDFAGNNVNATNGTFVTTQSNLFNGNTFNGIEANFTNGNFTNLTTVNFALTNLTAANGTFTNIVNSPLFNGGIFNGAAANLTGALTATTVNGIQANFSELNAANGNFTNIVNSPLFNGGDFVGNNVNAANGTFVTTQSNLFNGTTFNGIEANFTNGNFVNLVATNLTLSNLNAANGNFTNIVNSPLFNGGIFNGAAANLTGALTATTINGTQANFSELNAANGNFANIINSPLFNGGDFVGNNVNAANGTFTTTQSNLFNGNTFNGIEANFTNGNFTNLTTVNFALTNLTAANGTFTNIVNSPLFNGGIFNGAATNLTGALTATTVNGIQANFTELNAANGNFSNIVNSPLFNGGDFVGNNVNATNGTFVTTQSNLFNGNTFNGIEANFTNGNFVNLVATNLTLSNLNAANGNFTNIVNSPLFNGGIFNGAAANLTGALTATTVNGTQANFSELNAANGNFTNIVNSPLFNGGDFVGNNVNAVNGTFVTTQSNLFNGNTFNGIQANFTNGNFTNLTTVNFALTNLTAANGTFTNIVNSPLFNGGIFNGAATNLTGALTATTVNGIQANFSELNAANGNFANIVNSPLFNGGDFAGNNVNATNGTFVTTQSTLFNGTTFNGVQANFAEVNAINGNFTHIDTGTFNANTLIANNGVFTNFVQSALFNGGDFEGEDANFDTVTVNSIISSPLFNGGIFNGAAANLTGTLTAATVNGIQANFSDLNAANGNFVNIVNSPLFNGGDFVGNNGTFVTTQSNLFNGTTFNGVEANITNGNFVNLNATNLSISDLTAANGTFTNIVNSPLFNGGDFVGNNITATNGTFTTTQSTLFNGTTFNGIEANFTNGNFNTVNANFINGGTFTGTLQDPTINGTAFFTNNSFARFNGTLQITNAASNGFVLTSDANGIATWQPSIGVDNLGNHNAEMDLNLNGFSLVNGINLNAVTVNASNINAANGNFTNIVNSPLFNGGDFVGNNVSATNGSFVTTQSTLFNGTTFNGVEANFTELNAANGNFTNIVNSTLFNGGDFIGNNVNATNGSFVTTQSNLFNGNTFNGIEANFTNGNFVNLNATNLSISNLNAANGTFTNIVNSPLFNGGIFNGAAANLTGTLTATTVNGSQANFSNLNTANGNFTNIVNSALFNGGDFAGNNVSATNGTFATTQSTLFNGTTFNGIEANFTNGNFVNLVATNLTLSNLNAANGNFTNIVNSPLFNGGDFVGNNVNATNGTFITTQSTLFNGTTFNGIEANFTNGNFTTVNASFINGGTFTGTLQDPTINGTAFFTNNSFARFNGTLQITNAASNGFVLTSDANGIATWQPSIGVDNLGNHNAEMDLNLNGFSLVNGINLNAVTINTSNINAANGNFTNIINSPLFNGGDFVGNSVSATNGTFVTTQSTFFNGTTFNGMEANFINLNAANLSVSNLNAANGNFTNIVNSPLFNGGIFNGAAANLAGTLTAATVNGIQANFSNLNAANGNFTNIVNSPLFNGGDFVGNNVSATNGTFTTTQSTLFNGTTFNGIEANFTNGNFTNLSTVNFTLTNLTAANGTFTNIVNSPLFNGGIFNGAEANLTGALNATTINGTTFDGDFTNGSILFANTAGRIIEDNANFFWDNTNNRLGIGTSTPSSLLTVFANGNDILGVDNSSDGQLRLRATGPHAQAVTLTPRFVNGPLFPTGGAGTAIQSNTQLALVGASGISFSGTGAASDLFLNASGNLGINNTSPNAKLAITINSATEQGVILRAAAAQTANLQEWQNSAGTTLAVIDNAGDLGINITNPIFDAHINGSLSSRTFRMTNGATADFVLTSNATGNATWRNLATLPGNGDDLGNHTATQALNMAGFTIRNAAQVNGTTANFSANINAAMINGTTIDGDFTNGSILFSNAGGGLSQDNADFFWDRTNERLGVGTNSPSTLIQAVEQGVTPEAFTLGAPQRAIGVQGNGAAYFVGRDIANNIEFIMGSSALGNAFIGSMTAHDLDIRTNNTSRMRIANSTGNIGINNTNPNAKLAINIDTATEQGVILRAAAAQTANLQEWQNSAGTTLAVIDNAGDLGINIANPIFDAHINGSLSSRTFRMTNGATADFVLTSNATGNATWRNLATLPGNGDDLGNHTATQALNMAGFTVRNAAQVNGTTANFSGNVNAAMINGTTIDGDFTNGSIIFSNAGGNLSQDNTNLAWNDSTNRLRVGNNASGAALSVGNAAGGINDYISLSRGGTDWRIWASDGTTGTPSMRIGGNSAGSYAWQFDWTGTDANIMRSPNGTASQNVINFSGVAGQTGALTRWTNSAGTTLALIDNAGDLGINIANPTFDAHINGSLSSTTFRMTTGAGVNRVLRSDVNGNATWVDPTTLPSNGDDLGSHIANQGLTMSGFSITNIAQANGSIANFANGNLNNVNIGTTVQNGNLTLTSSDMTNTGIVVVGGASDHPIIRGNVPGSAAPTGDSFRVSHIENFGGVNVDHLVFDKVDANTGDPDGGISFTMTGNDNVRETSMQLYGNRNIDMFGPTIRATGNDFRIGQDLYHDGDTDTYLRYQNNDIELRAGNELLIDIHEDGVQDFVMLGDAGDVDISLNDDLRVEGSSGRVGIQTGTVAPVTELDVRGTITTNGFVMPNGAIDQYVLTTDGNGFAYWAEVVVDGNGLTANAAGTIEGAIQFRDSVGNMAADETTFFWDRTNERLGLNNNTPAYTLDATGSGRFTGDLHVGQYVYHDGDTDTHARFQDDDIEVWVGNERMFDLHEDGVQDTIVIGDGGDIDIDLNNDLIIDGASSNVRIPSNLAVGQDLSHDGDADTYMRLTNNDIEFRAGNEQLLDLHEDGTQDIVTIGDGGDVDINLNNDMFIEGSSSRVGLNTIAPTSLLDVNGTLTTDGFTMPTGAAVDRILRSDGTGNASWVDISSLASNGDDLGSHTATQALAMAGFSVTNAGQVNGTTANFNNARVNTQLTIPTGAAVDRVLRSDGTGNASWVNLATLPGNGDDLGSHTATQALAMAGFSITSAGQVNGTTANFSNVRANTQLTIPTGAAVDRVLRSDGTGNATWVNLATLPGNGDDLGNHTATQALAMAGFSITNAAQVNGTTANFNNARVNTQLTIPTGAAVDRVLRSDGTGNATWVNLATLPGNGDDLGSHTATQALAMAGFSITNAAQVNGTTANFNNARVNTQLTIPTGAAVDRVLRSDGTGNASWVDLATLPGNGDNLGNHTATQALAMAGFSVTNAGQVNGTTANFNNARVNTQLTIPTGAAVDRVLRSDGTGNASWVNLATLPGNGDDLGSHTATQALAMAGFSITSAGQVNGTTANFNNARVNTQLTIPTGAAVDRVLRSDGTGNASWVNLATLPGNGDDLGSHTATQALAMAGFSITSAGQVNGTTANFSNVRANTQLTIPTGAAVDRVLRSDGTGNASWVDLATLPGNGDDLGSHTATQALAMAGFSVTNAGQVNGTTANFSNVRANTQLTIPTGAAVDRVLRSDGTGNASWVNLATLPGNGDDLGSHTATQALAMAGFSVTNAGQVNGTTANFSNVRANTQLTIPTGAAVDRVLRSDGTGNASWVDLATLPGNGDNLGNHTATQALAMAGFSITSAGQVNGTTANFSNVRANTQLTIPTGAAVDRVLRSDGTGNASWVDLATLPGNGDDLGSHTATQALAMAGFSITSAGQVNGTTANFSNARVNTQLTIPTGAAVDRVLRSDGTGNASWVNLATLPGNGDDLGSHTATQALAMAGFSITSAGQVNGTTANFNNVRANTQLTIPTGAAVDRVLRSDGTGNASWVNLATLPGNGDDLGSHTATQALAMAGFSITNAGQVNGTTANFSNARVNTQLTIPTGAAVDRVLRSDGTGNASWVDQSTLNVGNADTLDGLDSVAFLRSNTSDNYTSGTLTLDSGTEINTASGSTVDIDGNLEIADTNISLNGASTTFTQTTGDITLAPAAGSNLDVTLSAGGIVDIAGNLTVASVVRSTPTDVPPTCNPGMEGGMYYDDSQNEPCFCDGANWQQFDGGGTCP